MNHFQQGSKVFYPYSGYGKGIVVEVKKSQVFGSASDTVYQIEFESGNIATLFENPKLVAFDPENERMVEMANQYTKAQQVGAKVSKGKSKKSKSNPKPAVKKAAEPTKMASGDKAGWIPLKDAAARVGMTLSQFWGKKLVTKEVESKQFGNRWYIKESTLF